MNTKNITIALLMMHVFSVHGRWVVSRIDFHNSDLSSEKSVAYYGANSLLELAPLTELLRAGSNNKNIIIPDSHGAVGKSSQGFNKFTLHDSNNVEHAVVFDGQNGFRLQQGRVKATSLDPNLGRYTGDVTGFVARGEVQQGDQVLASHTQNHQNEGDRFALVISGFNGNYSLELQPEPQSAG